MAYVENLVANCHQTTVIVEHWSVGWRGSVGGGEGVWGVGDGEGE